MAVQSGNVYDSIPEDLREEVFSEIARGEKVRMERIVSKGHVSPVSGWYDQAEHEWVIVLQGEARLQFENGEEKHLVAGSHVTIPAHTKHKVTWTDPDTETIWLAVFYS